MVITVYTRAVQAKGTPNPGMEGEAGQEVSSLAEELLAVDSSGRRDLVFLMV